MPAYIIIDVLFIIIFISYSIVSIIQEILLRKTIRDFQTTHLNHDIYSSKGWMKINQKYLQYPKDSAKYKLLEKENLIHNKLLKTLTLLKNWLIICIFVMVFIVLIFF